MRHTPRTVFVVLAAITVGPKLASRCNVVGRIEGDPRSIGRIRAGEKLKVSEA